MQMGQFFRSAKQTDNKIMISILQNTRHYVIYKVLAFKSNFKCVFIHFYRYTVQTPENSRTEIFRVWYFLSARCYLSLGKRSQRVKIWQKRRTTFSCFRYSRSIAALCDESLSCNNLTPRRPVAGRRFFKYFFGLWRTLPFTYLAFGTAFWKADRNW